MIPLGSVVLPTTDAMCGPSILLYANLPSASSSLSPPLCFLLCLSSVWTLM
jgi:hypothetical protein